MYSIEYIRSSKKYMFLSHICYYIAFADVLKSLSKIRETKMPWEVMGKRGTAESGNHMIIASSVVFDRLSDNKGNARRRRSNQGCMKQSKSNLTRLKALTRQLIRVSAVRVIDPVGVLEC